MKNVLIVDDEVSLAQLLADLLQYEGYRVMTATNGREALACLHQARPDMVLCDVMMPVMNGIEVCHALRADPLYRTVPIVMMTAAPGSISQEDCDYQALLAKPFDIDTVLELVIEMTGRPASA